MDTRDKSIMLSYAKDIVCAAIQGKSSPSLSDATKSVLIIADELCDWLQSPNTMDEKIRGIIRPYGDIAKALAEHKTSTETLIRLYIECNKCEGDFIKRLERIVASWQG